MSNLKVVLIPYWLRDLVQQQGQHINTIVDYDKIKSLLSTDNKITLLQTQELSIGRFNAQALSTGAHVLAGIWTDSNESVAGEIADLINEAQRRTSSSGNNASLFAQLRLELDTPVSPKVIESTQEESLAEVIDTGTGVVGIIIEPQIGKISQEAMYDLVQSILRIFYKYESPYLVASHPLFRTYLDMMRMNKMVGD